MEVRILRKKDEVMDFVVEGVSIAFANSLRRVMINEVPTLAIENVEFHENNSLLYDEIIAHRLGLIPLVCDPEKFNFSGECKCEGKGCPSCQVVFALEKTGPCMVYSGDLKSSNREVKPTNEKFLIVELLAGQKIKFEAMAKLGRGKEHAKWQAANAVYAYMPETAKDPKGFRFRVETISGLEPEKIVLMAAQILSEKADEFKKALGKI